MQYPTRYEAKPITCSCLHAFVRGFRGVALAERASDSGVGGCTWSRPGRSALDGGPGAGKFICDNDGARDATERTQ